MNQTDIPVYYFDTTKVSSNDINESFLNVMNNVIDLQYTPTVVLLKHGKAIHEYIGSETTLKQLKTLTKYKYWFVIEQICTNYLFGGINMKSKQELVLALTAFKETVNNHYVAGLIDETLLKLKKSDNTVQEAKYIYQRLNQVMLAEHLTLNDDAKAALKNIKEISESKGALGGLNSFNTANVL